MESLKMNQVQQILQMLHSAQSDESLRVYFVKTIGIKEETADAYIKTRDHVRTHRKQVKSTQS